MIAKSWSATLILLAALAAGGCGPRASVPRSAEAAPAVTNVAWRALPPSLVMGEQSCASSGCHGQAFDGATRDWRSAYAVWLAEDPHPRAFAVLYTERAVEMYRNLHPESKRSAEPPPDIPYEAFLGERCLGCHATGLRGRDVVALAEGDDRPAFYLAGVACESCHGPASGWLDTHYLGSFNRSTPGFHDTRPLASRAETCVGCHVGPMIAENGKAYDLDHDLIAAGHPRLAFEFASYLANLPKHWDEAKEIVSHQALGQPMTFHIDAWAAGQEQVARQLVRQVEHRLTAAKRDPNTTPWPDFSNFDCYDCHHTIGPPGNERTTSAQLAGRRNIPRPALAPLAMLRIMSGPVTAGENPSATEAVSLVETALSDSWQMPVAKINQPATEELAILTSRGQPSVVVLSGQPRWQQHAQWLLAQMQQWKRPVPELPQLDRFDPTWDQALNLYFGAVALAQDIEWQEPGLLHRAARALGGALEHSGFHRLGRPPTQYDSPTGFDHGMLDSALRDLEKALHAAAQFDSTSAAPSNP
ncbi:MAG: cytochrome c family protein [Planctomycetaceae bacterium]|nr:cytochrome c family protein [Planctomycetaceae bacterium]